MNWILLAGIPSILLTGLVQEGAKLVPVVVCWWRSGKSLDPKLGLAIGAVAGAGFGIFEAQQALNAPFAAGYITWDVMKTYGFMALIYTGFWHTFFTVAAHIAFAALAGYGLAKGRGWQFYLIAAVLHGLLNYANVLYSAQVLTDIQAVIYITVLAVLVTAWALWLRWRKGTSEAEAETEAETETETDTETEVSTP
jgi:RsiW-degrading membrane proteinase PrsW (M82 family)